MKKFTVSEVEEILNSMDGIQPAEAPLYMYSKIRNRLATKSTDTGNSFQVKPLLVIGMLLGCMIINIWILSQQKQKINNTSNSSIVDFSSEYGLNDSYAN
ncbi:MAG: hypothetical protein IKD55_13015 [Sediminibacterium sp.]|nr:hypothetical protein [Sediminibacterium sp.]